ncbi:uncharacterized protein LOC133300138 [Gastrolobium bilobum]|uniref:uncharacterized protein LOC133300138 n=1 Tax=Gastrolobium bilobum TaxID=150636 RepID=UPI002AB02F2B|nr:uncharacterized protein LOC133300138 [Gastrolobium bilobum]
MKLGYMCSKIHFDLRFQEFVDSNPQVATWIDQIPKGKWCKSYNEDDRRREKIQNAKTKGWRIAKKVEDFLQKNDQLIVSLRVRVFDRDLQLFEVEDAYNQSTHDVGDITRMIRRAITELNEGTGSSVEEITEFIGREYEDLPLAHVKILGVHLRKLCHEGELARTDSGRYVVLFDGDDGMGDGEQIEQCKGSKKRERGKRMQEEGIKKQIKVLELDGGSTNEPNRVVEWTQEHGKEEEEESSQIPESILHLETIRSSQSTVLNLPGDSEQPLLVPISEGLPQCKPAAGIGLSLTHLQLQVSCHGPSESSLDSAAKTSASLSSLNFQKHKQDENPMPGDPEQQPLKLQCRGRPPKSKRPCKSKIVADYQGESLLPSGDAFVTGQNPNVNKIDKWWLSRPQGRGIGRGRKSKLHRKAHRVQPQEQAQGLLSSPYSGQKETIYSSQPTTWNSPINVTRNFGQQLAVPTLEGPPGYTVIKLSPTQLQLQVSSDIDLVTRSNMKGSLTCLNVHDKQPQHCNQGSPDGNLDENPMSGDGNPEEKPIKRPRGRPRKLETVENYSGESLLPSEDGILDKQEPNINKMEKKHQNGSRRGRGRPRKPNPSANQCEEQLQEDQRKQHGRGRGRGRRPKLSRNANQDEEHLQQKNQARQQYGRGRRPRGRPRKLSQNSNQYEEQLRPQDQAQSLVSSPNSGGIDNQILKEKQLEVQCRGRNTEN